MTRRRKKTRWVALRSFVPSSDLNMQRFVAALETLEQQKKVARVRMRYGHIQLLTRVPR